MDARSDAAPGGAATPADRTALDPAELRTLLTSLSHELCRPLITLRAGFDLLLGDAAPPIAESQRGHVETMAGLCDGLLVMTRSYLDYAGLVRGSRPLRLGTFTVGALIREVDREFAGSAAARRLDWGCALEGDDGTVVTDPGRCQQIFGNLVSNAIKYTPEGGRVEVVARRDGGRWEVTVADTGPGIPEEEVGRVFEPFYRLPRDERSGAEGHGLGLAICRELIGQLGGGIEIRPAPGGGTAVHVRFAGGTLPDADQN